MSNDSRTSVKRERTPSNRSSGSPLQSQLHHALPPSVGQIQPRSNTGSLSTNLRNSRQQVGRQNATSQNTDGLGTLSNNEADTAIDWANISLDPVILNDDANARSRPRTFFEETFIEPRHLYEEFHSEPEVHDTDLSHESFGLHSILVPDLYASGFLLQNSSNFAPRRNISARNGAASAVPQGYKLTASSPLHQDHSSIPYYNHTYSTAGNQQHEPFFLESGWFGPDTITLGMSQTTNSGHNDYSGVEHSLTTEPFVSGDVITPWNSASLEATQNQSQFPDHQQRTGQLASQDPDRSTYPAFTQSRTPAGKHTCAEAKCQRGVRVSGNFCKRHQEKFERNNAPPPQIPYLEDVTFERAMSMVYPEYPTLCRSEPDPTVIDSIEYENQWVQCFLRAAMTEIDVNSPTTTKFEREQQKTFNGKARMESRGDGRYTHEWINARMRMLYRATFVFHAGGKAVYPVGGDNGGYGKPEARYTFQQRLVKLRDSLKWDKLTVMNVIEGRGVVALVQNPDRFQKRKTQNKQSNQKKDEVLEAERKRQREGTAGEDDEQSEDEVNGEDEHEPEEVAPNTGQGYKATGKRKSQTFTGSSQGPSLRRSKRVKTQTDVALSDQSTPHDQVPGRIFDPSLPLLHEADLVASLPQDYRFPSANTKYFHPADGFEGIAGAASTLDHIREREDEKRADDRYCEEDFYGI